MGTFSIWHWLIVLVVVLVLFGGGGKLSKLMGDMGKGVTSFKKGLKEGANDKEQDKAEGSSEPPKAIDSEPSAMASNGEAENQKDKTAANG